MQQALVAVVICGFASSSATAASEGSKIRSYVDAHCLDCHDGPRAKAGLDLARLGFDLGDKKTFAAWVKVHDRVRDGEMPPRTAGDPPPRAQTAAFLATLADPLVATDLARAAGEGRAVRRRLNRHEYENTLRVLFHAPWLQVKDMLPEDGESHRFNKVGEALDVSHVQIAQYMAAAEYAMREALAAHLAEPAATATAPPPVRYHARDMRSFSRLIVRPTIKGKLWVRYTFPTLGFDGQPDVIERKVPVTVGETDPVKRELEGVGVVSSSYEPIEPKFDKFRAPRGGRYRLRVHGHSAWVGAYEPPNWWWPDMGKISRGRRPEPVTLYAERPPSVIRRLGSFDLGVEPTTRELEVYLQQGETIRPDAARLFRSRPPRVQEAPLTAQFRNPLAERDGQPGVVFRWLEVQGPLPEEGAEDARALLFADLPIKAGPGGSIDVTPNDANADARRLMQAFVDRVYRRPAAAEEVERFLGVVTKAFRRGAPFGEAMMSGYSAVLCSPAFVYLDEPPGPLDGLALASRLSYFLWNSPPDEALRAAAVRGDLMKRGVLRAQAARLLDDPRSRRFVDAFLDYWLDLRRLAATSPDAVLYPDYNLDDLLVESSAQETQLFFSELLRNDLPARNLVDSDFTFVNERLAAHYGLPRPPGLGVELRKVRLPRQSPRGGLMTQASVLKVTANGTTTSPVLRGVWISERLLGFEVPPPPAGVPAVEPDIRGAKTIREQLAKHSADKTCAPCHAKIDPAGFALESFDVFGGHRARYRAMGDMQTGIEGYGKDGLRFEFRDAQPVDASGILPDGGKFRDVEGLKRLLVRDERRIARNLAKQLVVYATGAPVRFGDRPALEAILDQASTRRYGVRTLALQIIDSDLFRSK